MNLLEYQCKELGSVEVKHHFFTDVHDDCMEPETYGTIYTFNPMFPTETQLKNENSFLNKKNCVYEKDLSFNVDGTLAVFGYSSEVQSVFDVVDLFSLEIVKSFSIKEKALRHYRCFYAGNWNFWMLYSSESVFGDMMDAFKFNFNGTWLQDSRMKKQASFFMANWISNIEDKMFSQKVEDIKIGNVVCREVFDQMKLKQLKHLVKLKITNRKLLDIGYNNYIKSGFILTSDNQGAFKINMLTFNDGLLVHKVEKTISHNPLELYYLKIIQRKDGVIISFSFWQQAITLYK